MGSELVVGCKEAPGGDRIVLYDGECNLCDSVVRFILPRDPSNYFRFAALQSEIGIQILSGCSRNALEVDSVVLVMNGTCHFESTAVFKIAGGLAGLWPLLGVLLLIPKPLRDSIYRWIGDNRSRWFGQPSSCILTINGFEDRFLS